MVAGRPRSPLPAVDEYTATGFRWGSLEVQRTAIVEGHYVVTIKTEAGVQIEVLVSATGSSARVRSVVDDEFLLTRGGRHPRQMHKS